MSDKAKQSFEADCRDFARKLYRMNCHIRYTDIAKRVMQALSWINIPMAFSSFLYAIVYREASLFLLVAVFGTIAVTMSLCGTLALAYKYMLKECEELDRCAKLIRDQVVEHPEWQGEPIVVEL